MPTLRRHQLEQALANGATVAHAPGAPAAHAAPGRNKYRAVPTMHNGVRYASKAEAARAQRLDELVVQGQVVDWFRQVTFRLGVPENRYVADFVVLWRDGAGVRACVEDVKGQIKAADRRTLRLWNAYGRLPLLFLRRSGATWTTVARAGPA